MGYLSIVCSKANSSQGRFVVANRTYSSDLNVSVSVLPGNYTVVVYGLTSNGLPVSSGGDNPYVLAAEEKNITVTNSGDIGGKGLQ